jgi:hypothetical protein
MVHGQRHKRVARLEQQGIKDRNCETWTLSHRLNESICAYIAPLSHNTTHVKFVKRANLRLSQGISENYLDAIMPQD